MGRQHLGRVLPDSRALQRHKGAKPTLLDYTAGHMKKGRALQAKVQRVNPLWLTYCCEKAVVLARPAPRYT